MSKIFGFLAKYFYVFSAIIPKKIAISSWLANETPFLFDGASEGPFRNLDLCIWARARPIYSVQFSWLILVFSRSSSDLWHKSQTLCTACLKRQLFAFNRPKLLHSGDLRSDLAKTASRF